MFFDLFNHLRSHTTSSIFRKDTEKNTKTFFILNSYLVVIEEERTDDFSIIIIADDTIS